MSSGGIIEIEALSVFYDGEVCSVVQNTFHFSIFNCHLDYFHSSEDSLGFSSYLYFKNAADVQTE